MDCAEAERAEAARVVVVMVVAARAAVRVGEGMVVVRVMAAMVVVWRCLRLRTG